MRNRPKMTPGLEALDNIADQLHVLWGLSLGRSPVELNRLDRATLESLVYYLCERLKQVSPVVSVIGYDYPFAAELKDLVDKISQEMG